MAMPTRDWVQTGRLRSRRGRAPAFGDPAACYRTRRAKTHGRSRGDRRKDAHCGRVREGSRAGIAVAFSRGVTVRTSQGGSQKWQVDRPPNPDDVRHRWRCSWRWYARAHKVCAVSTAKCSGGLCDVAGRAVCCPRKVDPPTVPVAPDAGDGRGSLFAPSAWVVLSTPVQKQIDLKLYGFYIGDLQVPVAQVDVPIRMAKFLTVTPSYMCYSVPASGLNEMHAATGENLPTATRSTNFESTGPWRSPFASSRSPVATCMSEGFVQRQQTT